ncbi:phosphopantetheine-binding protein [Pyxidicoccus sp. MSG2]|nr:phosphopantetheine-binding protein [Pyxidicoccus sp. MSG2]MCY1021119.1 phosphopantetheine-binding protein [Pyxidicoccus sp. MSG2]
MYRTGDLARWLPGGLLGFEGRNDTQLKFNGHRVQELLPQYFVPLPQLPLTPKCKVDTKALPRMEEAKGRMRSMSAPPRTPTKLELAAIWRKSIELSEVGVDDDFFEIAGHSLLTNQIILRPREALGVDLNMRSIFEHRTVATLARSIEQARASAKLRVATGARTKNVPLPRFIPGLATACEVQPTPGAVSKKSDEENLVLAESITSMDEKIGEFHSRFPWPWNSSMFASLQDPDFERTLVSQEVEDFSHTAVPPVRPTSGWRAVERTKPSSRRCCSRTRRCSARTSRRSRLKSARPMPPTSA